MADSLVGHRLALQLRLADRAVHDLVVAAILFTGSRDLVLLHRFAGRMAQLFYGLRRAAQLLLADRAVHDLVVAAILFTGGRDFVLLHGFARRVLQPGNSLSAGDPDAAALAPGVAGIALGGAGGRHGVPDLRAAGVVLRIDVHRLRPGLATLRAGIGAHALFTAGGRGGDFAPVPGMVVFLKLRIQGHVPTRRIFIGIAIRVRPAGEGVALAGNRLRRGQLAAHPATVRHVAVVVLPGHVHHHRRTLEDIRGVAPVVLRLGGGRLPLAPLFLDLFLASFEGVEVAVSVAVVRQVLADLLGQAAEHRVALFHGLVPDIAFQRRVLAVAGVVQQPVAPVHIHAVQLEVLGRHLVFLADRGQDIAALGGPVDGVVARLEGAIAQRVLSSPALGGLGLPVQAPGDRIHFAGKVRVQRQVAGRHGGILLALRVGPVIEGEFLPRGGLRGHRRLAIAHLRGHVAVVVLPGDGEGLGRADGEEHGLLNRYDRIVRYLVPQFFVVDELRERRHRYAVEILALIPIDAIRPIRLMDHHPGGIDTTVVIIAVGRQRIVPFVFVSWVAVHRFLDGGGHILQHVEARFQLGLIHRRQRRVAVRSFVQDMPVGHRVMQIEIQIDMRLLALHQHEELLVCRVYREQAVVIAKHHQAH